MPVSSLVNQTSSTWAEIIPFLITAIITVFSVAFGTFLFKIVWYWYGKLELERIARVTMPVPKIITHRNKNWRI